MSRLAKGATMEVIGLIIKAERGKSEELLHVLSHKQHVGIYDVRENQIVLVLDTDDIRVVARNTKEISEMQGVISVHPVFSLDSLAF